jgi:hypothetical protein
MPELGEEVTLGGLCWLQSGEPLRIDVDVARCAGTHPPADRRYSEIKLPKGFHELAARKAIDSMLVALHIYHSQRCHPRSPACT